jgi:acyl-CoA reductase-like NAD-dependent aldehyde dehydrogenase
MAVVAAKKAFAKWSKTSAQERANILYKIADLLERDKEKFAKAESIDQGKTYKRALEIELPRAVLNFRFFAGAILHQKETSTTVGDDYLNYTLRQPVGVAGLISPWNLPLYLITWKLAPALAYGNTAVCKPSEFTSMTAFMLASILQEANLPEGVCNMVFGTGERAGSVLVEHPSVPLISFTGGTATGEKIYRASATHFKKLSLELGGKNPNIIFNDADLKKCVPMTINSSFANQGEICLCGSRIYVQDEILPKFLEQFKAETEKLIVGDPLDEKTFVGPLVSAQHLDKVMSCVEKAKNEGAKILSGGERLNINGGYFMKPTIITDLDRCSDLMQTEIFGPVVTITPFKYMKDVVELANTGPYGLSASIWTQDVSRAHKMAAKLDAGMVWVNTWTRRDLRLPFGGMKSSGIGREGGDTSIDFFTETKTVGVEI